MRKQITLTIDSEVYEELQDLPRRVSVSEVASWMLKIFIEQFKKGRELTEEEFIQFMKWTPGGRDFIKRARQDPKMKAMAKVVNMDKTAEELGRELGKAIRRKVGRPPKKPIRVD